ncbi:hypothetical protein ABB25_13940 [Stenotrophomonas koreensis]|uniref:Uncharacterized protein n=1 Tax=Stenotrophomonas koreensis TaxID=266128 RepID=A0A0R0BKW9_9GAMM|nr:hypothetical protein ABB25_13940 [Stenotrophomonas koreensis]
MVVPRNAKLVDDFLCDALAAWIAQVRGGLTDAGFKALGPSTAMLTVLITVLAHWQLRVSQRGIDLRAEEAVVAR